MNVLYLEAMIIKMLRLMMLTRRRSRQKKKMMKKMCKLLYLQHVPKDPPPVRHVQFEKNRVCRGSGIKVTYMLDGQISPFLPKSYIGATDPVNVFEYFFDNDVCKYLADMSTKYARIDKGVHNIQITVADIRCFIGILLLSGYISVPRWRMLWEVDSETFNATVSNAMRRSQYENIKRYLHCADIALLKPGDKFAKMRPLMAMLNERYLACASLEEHLCVDESMAPYFGRHGAKQFIRGKPVRFGFKFWCLCDRRGYLIQFEPYQSGQYDKDIGLGASVVLDVMSEVPRGIPFKLFGDRFFTSLHLIDDLNPASEMTYIVSGGALNSTHSLDDLKAYGYGYTGTVMLNRTERCPVMIPKLLAKKHRGFCDYQLDQSANVLVVGWNDNRPVYLASNIHGVSPVGVCTRWSSSEKKKVTVQLPDLAGKYNKYMGGVDRMDQNTANYRVGVRSTKWWWVASVCFLCRDRHP